MKKIKTYHIHTDFKFVNSISRFEGGNFENFNVFISNDYKSYKSLGPGHLFFKESELEQIIKLCKSADLVVLYDLDDIKSKLVLSLPKSVKKAWRFFGHELYGKDRDKYISRKTRKAYLTEGKSFIKKLHPIVRRLYCYSYIPGTNVYLFKKAMSKIDFFLGLSFEEYQLFSERWKSLPPFVKLSSYPPKTKELSYSIDLKREKKVILLGNSKSYNNNHLDIFDIVDSSSNHRSYNFKVLFNYGLENSYTEKVRGVCNNKDYYKLIEDFMTTKEFNLFYNETSALVLNNYRQLAMGNIRYAFINGVKVYLNKNNVFYHKLKKDGFKVFNIDKLKIDLDDGNFYLSHVDAENNFNKLIQIANSYTKYDFQNVLYNYF